MKRKIEETDCGALWIKGKKGQMHLVVDETESLHGLVKQMVAACKGNDARVDDFLIDAIKNGLTNWESK